MSRCSRIAIGALLAVGLTACSGVRAKMPPPVVALEIPPPPARVAVPVLLSEPEELSPSATVTLTPSTSTPRTRDNSTAARPVDRPPAPAAPPPPEAPPAQAPAPVLQTTTDVGSIQQKTEWLLGQAQRDLDTITARYNSLGSQARGQYENAATFIKNARKALEIKNYMFAEQLATKAAALANALVKG